jgi:hypothetical protein
MAVSRAACLLYFIVAFAVVPVGAAVSIHSVTQSGTQIGLYRPLTIQFSLSKSYSNP